ncbi:MAG: aldehyde dehydrogenase family protein [Steroidobacteraceae bacterium]
MGGGASSLLLNPFTEERLYELIDASPEVVEDAVLSAFAAYRASRHATPAQRSAWLERCADALRSDLDLLVDLIVSDIGKPRRVARGEVQRSIAFMRLCAAQLLFLEDSAPQFEAVANGKDHLGFTRRTPYGVVAAVTPFNAPMNLLMQKVAPALAAGNAVVVKPHPAGSRVAVRAAMLFAKAGLPAGLFNVVTGDRQPAAQLAAHRQVRVVTFTGGQVAADALVRAAGAKKFLAELGSNSANVVLKDADCKDAAARIAAAGFEASGQQCVSAQRVIVEHAVSEEFIAAFVAATAALKVGDPDDEATDVGPVVSRAAADRIEQLLEDTIASGARYLLQPRRSGCLISPAIIGGADQSSPLWCHEVFGPAVTVHVADDADHALTLANDSPFGLQGALFTNNLDEMLRFSRDFEVGSLWVNEPSRFRLDMLPFGGVKQSGYGREGVRHAIEELSQITVTGIRMRKPG